MSPTAPSAQASAASSSRAVELKRSVPGRSVYSIRLAIKRPLRGVERISIRAENGKVRRIAVRARPKKSKGRFKPLIVQIRAEVTDGTLNIRAQGRKRRPKAKLLQVTSQATAGAKFASTGLHPPTLPVPQQLVWNDEFDGAASTAPAADKWTMDVGGHGWGNNELQAFTSRPQNVSQDGAGSLSVTARAERYAGSDGYTRDYTSGRLHAKGKFSMTYGRLDARVRVPAGKGLWSCVWMMGDDIWDAGWPTAGEIDVLEVLGQDTTTGYGTLHGPIGMTQASWGSGNPFKLPQPMSSDYHVFGIIWTPNAVEWTVDGLAYARIDRTGLPPGARWVFDHGFHPVLSLAVGGDWPGSPDSSTQFPATMSVDWIRAYN